MWDQVLAECRANLGEPPRRFNLWDRLVHLRFPQPSWLRKTPGHGLSRLFRFKNDVMQRGSVVWGFMIMANAHLFDRGRVNCPGCVVYSPNPKATADPEHLANVAEALGELKETQPEEADLAMIANSLTDEMSPFFGVPVPRSISPNVPCVMSWTFFARHQLPRRRLCCPLMPLVVIPDARDMALVLPARFWPREFVRWWGRWPHGDAGFADESGPPIRNLDAVDVLGKLKDGGVELVIVAAGPLVGDRPTQELLVAKVKNYLAYVGSSDFKAEFGDLPADKKTITIACRETPDPTILALIEKMKPSVAKLGARLALHVEESGGPSAAHS